jgi:hypothetical protein
MKYEMTTSLDDEILSTNFIAKSLSMIDINLHDHCLKFSTRHVDHLIVLLMLFQLRLEIESVCSPI